MRTYPHLSFARTLLVAAATVSLGLGLGLGCKVQPGNQVDPSVKSDEAPKKKVVFDEDPEPNPDGIELKPVGQGGGPPDEAAGKPSATPVTPPTPVVTKPPATPKPKPTTTATPSSSAPPTWTPPPLPSGWTWPFPTGNAPPQGSTSPPPPVGGQPDAGTGGVALPPFGGS